MKNLFNSIGGRKVGCAILSALVVAANDYYNIGMSPQELLIAVSGFLSFIGVEGFGDMLERYAMSGRLDQLQELSDQIIDQDKEGESDGDSS